MSVEETGSLESAFKWRKCDAVTSDCQQNSGDCLEEFSDSIAMSASSIDLMQGVTIEFGSVTGHTTSDKWCFSVSVINPIAVMDASGTRTFTVTQDGAVFAAGGATVHSGMTVEDGGLTVAQGGVHVDAGGLTIARGGLTVDGSDGVGMNVTGGMEISGGSGSEFSGGVTVSAPSGHTRRRSSKPRRCGCLK